MADTDEKAPEPHADEDARDSEPDGFFDEVAAPTTDDDTVELTIDAEPPNGDDDDSDLWPIEAAPELDVAADVSPDVSAPDALAAAAGEIVAAAPERDPTPAPLLIAAESSRTRDEAAEERRGERERSTPRQVIAMASGKGGVGKSIIAASIGIYLAQLGKQVVLVDANLGSGNLHTLVGAEQSEPSLQSFLSKDLKRLRDATITTPFSNMGLISGHGDGMGTANPRPAQKNRLLSQLRALPTDYVVIDTAPGTGFNTLDTFLAADVHIVVMQPEPSAIESAFRLIKSAFLRKVRGLDGIDKLADRLAPIAHCGIPTPHQLHAAAQDLSLPLAKQLYEAMSDFRPLLVLNKTRTREDLELGPALAVIGRRHLGLPMEYIGYVEHDDLVWVSVRKRRPLLVQFSEAKVCKDLERLARRILARESPDRTSSDAMPVPLSAQNHYEILGIHPGAPEAEVRSAQRRVRRIYDAASPAIYGVAPPLEVEQMLRRVEQAYATLVDPEKSQEYIRSIFPDWQGSEEPTSNRPSDLSAPPPQKAVREGILAQADVEPLPTAPMPVLTAETEYTGALLKAVREARGLELTDIAESTKISAGHLRAIEEENFSNTPAPVYLRGFVRAVAKHLKLEPEQVVKTYMQRHPHRS